jgi:hypothetical protein
MIQEGFSLGQSSSLRQITGLQISFWQNSPAVQFEQGFRVTQTLDIEQLSPDLQSQSPEQNGLHTLSTHFSNCPQSVLCVQEIRGKQISPFTNSKGSGQRVICVILQIPYSHVEGNTHWTS